MFSNKYAHFALICLDVFLSKYAHFALIFLYVFPNKYAHFTLILFLFFCMCFLLSMPICSDFFVCVS